MAESPEEKEALEKLDEVTREVAVDELDREGDRELRQFRPGPLAWLGFRRLARKFVGRPLPPEDPDPIDERGLRDALRSNDEKD